MVVEKGKLAPGSVLVVDTFEGQLLLNDEVKARVAAQRPYSDWLSGSMVRAPEHAFADGLTTPPWDEEALRRHAKTVWL
jgi:hypothetical protein